VKSAGKKAAKGAEGEAAAWLKECEDFIAAMTALSMKGKDEN